jgi:NAD-dependent deacetylase
MLTTSLRTAVTLLRDAKYVVALTGAGVSTPSGIPDFRSPHAGLWEHHNPAEVASLYGFRHHPERFFDWIRPLVRIVWEADPNPAHRALAHLETSGKLKSIITQNVDMLHTRAGSKTVYELHGHLREVTCTHCFQVYPADPYIRDFLATDTLPYCPDCGYILKPNVILLGEQLPARMFVAARRDAQRCDVMLVVGSSLTAYPVARLPMIARQAGASLILINLCPTPVDSHAQVTIHCDVVDVLPPLVAALESETQS